MNCFVKSAINRVLFAFLCLKCLPMPNRCMLKWGACWGRDDNLLSLLVIHWVVWLCSFCSVSFNPQAWLRTFLLLSSQTNNGVHQSIQKLARLQFHNNKQEVLKPARKMQDQERISKPLFSICQLVIINSKGDALMFLCHRMRELWCHIFFVCSQQTGILPEQAIWFKIHVWIELSLVCWWSHCCCLSKFVESCAWGWFSLLLSFHTLWEKGFLLLIAKKPNSVWTFAHIWTKMANRDTAHSDHNVVFQHSWQSNWFTNIVWHVLLLWKFWSSLQKTWNCFSSKNNHILIAKQKTFNNLLNKFWFWSAACQMLTLSFSVFSFPHSFRNSSLWQLCWFPPAKWNWCKLMTESQMQQQQHNSIQAFLSAFTSFLFVLLLWSESWKWSCYFREKVSIADIAG